MEFYQFKSLFQKNFKELTKDESCLFEVDLDKDELWNLYLDSFPHGTNEIYRERREYDCSCCRHFIKTIGNVVVAKNGEIHTIWDFTTGEDKFQQVINALSAFVKSKVIADVFLAETSKIGTDKNYESTETGVDTWEHFYLEVPEKFVHHQRGSIAEAKGVFRDTRNVFRRSLDEIDEGAILTVLELISQNSLYKGEEWKSILEDFLKYKREYDTLNEPQKELYAWKKSMEVGAVVGRIRNHSIGTLLVNISDNSDLDEAVRKYEAIVAPTNYKRPKAIFTKKMLEDAKKTVEELGLTNSLNRRFATIDDITVNNILFANRDSTKRMTSKDVFEEMSSDVAVNPKRFSKVEEVGIEKFVKDILPNAKEMEVLLENRHTKNMVSLIAPEDKDSSSMFKWNNSFGWAYSGNITDSIMKERVKAAGGKVDGVLRFSIQWNDGSAYNQNDLDAHCITPKGNRIYYGCKYDCRTGGKLDVDIISPIRGKAAVENITWASNSNMKPGVYKFFVNVYSNSGGTGGFRAEIEFDGQLYSFDYQGRTNSNQNIQVAEVTLDSDGKFSIRELLESNNSIISKEAWNLNTNQFVPVSTMMYSPNYWDEQSGIGNKHYFFMLKDCVNPECPNGFYNEFLKEGLMKHKRVFEALGSKLAVVDSEDQLSGIGFSSTKRDELIVKVKGQTERTIKIKI